MSLLVKVFLFTMALLRLSSEQETESLDDEFATAKDYEDHFDEDDIQEIKYELKKPFSQQVFRLDENLTEPGSVVGGYRLEMPDHTLMVVEYLIAEGGGFQPRITYTKNPLYPEPTNN